jgi:hypothetical protein
MPGRGALLAIMMSTEKLRQNIKDKGQYYRFVFLDACYTANGGLPGAFGINFKGPVSFDYFQKHKIRPRAFLGYDRRVSYAGGPGDYIDPNTGVKYGWIVPDAVTYYLTNFQFFWYFGHDLLSALYWADVQTPPLPPGWQRGTGLQLYGYDGLGVDSYNARSDWQN